MGASVVWLPTFFYLLYIIYVFQTKFIQVWNEMRVKHFILGELFNSRIPLRLSSN